MTAAQDLTPPTALRSARLFDGLAFRDQPFVLLEAGRIVAVGEAPPESMDVVDLGDVTLLPGLIDCHQHLVFDGQGTLEEQVAGVDDETLRRRAHDAARVALAAGITTVRDLGDKSFVTLALRRPSNWTRGPGDDAALPTILSAGPPLTRVGGHCSYLGGECAGVEALTAAVRERAERGCDLVKVMVTGGVLTPAFPVWQTQFSDEEIQAVVEESHRLGLPVAAHCHGVDGIVQALDAGADSIEHCTFVAASGRCEPVPEVMERLATSDVAISGTLGRLPDQPIPPAVQVNWPIMVETFQQLYGLGATVVVGTDAGISPAKPHDVLPHAMSELAQCGISGVAALSALTSVAAKVCGLQDSKGRLAPGFDADLLAVRGDPVADPAALRSVAGVWRSGTRVSSSA